MEDARYYRFKSGDVILRRAGDRVEKFGKSGTWEYRPHLLARFMNAEEGLIEISAQEAQHVINARTHRN